MARYLAETICELAAPPLQPCFIRVQVDQELPALSVLLHVRPRPLTAGLEIAVYSGTGQDEEGELVHLEPEGTLFAVPHTQAGLEHFVSDLIAAGPAEWDETGRGTLALPTQASPGDRGWSRLQIDLLPPSDVHATLRVRPLGKRYLRTSMPALCEDNNCGQAKLRNWAADYADGQDAIKQSIEQRQKELASGTLEAALRAVNNREREQPDGPEVFQRKWRAARDAAEAELKAALLAMLRQALRYRGRIEFPVGAPAPAAAEAAPDAGQPAA